MNTQLTTIEDCVQYIDRNGIVYVASKNPSLDYWIDNMVTQHGLDQLIQMFPYVTLVVDPETRYLKTWTHCRYNAKVTNIFHVMWAQFQDQYYSQPVQEVIQEYYGLENLAKAYPTEDSRPERVIAPPSEETIVEDPNSGYIMNWAAMPAGVKIEALENWHPNKDARGNFIPKNAPAPYQQSYYAFYPQPIYYQYQYAYPQPMSYLPRYRNDGYPF